MPNSLYQDIRAALTKQAKTAAGFPSAIAYENYFFEPTDGTPYARLTLFPQSSNPFSVDGNTSQHRGMFQVDIACPAQNGTAQVESLADAVTTAFKTGLRLPAGSDTIRIDSSQRAPAMPDAAWITVPVTVSWRVFAHGNH